MSTAWKDLLYDTSWRATDEQILRMLEKERRWVAAGMVGHLSGIGHMLTHFHIRDSLRRLAERGLIERREVEEAVDLFEVVKVEQWRFVGRKEVRHAEA